MNAPLLSRGLPGLIAAVLAGGMSVAFLVLAVRHMNTPLMFLAYFTPLPLYLAGLGAGVMASSVAAVAGTLLLCVVQAPDFGAMYVMTVGVPAIALTGMALRYRFGQDQQPHWYPEGKILTAATLYPCILFLIAAIGTASHPGGLLDITTTAFNEAGTKLAATFNDEEAQAFHAMMANAAKIAPAMASYVWIFVTMLCLVGAQQTLQKKNMNLRSGFSITELRVPNWLIYSVAATGLVGVFAPAPYEYIGRNLSLILGLPFFFEGVAIVHAMAAGIQRGWVLLFLFYAVMTFIPWIALIVAALGIIDQWVDFRQRIANKPTA